MAAPFDATRLEVTGAAVPAIAEVAAESSNGVAQFSVSNHGALAYIAGPALAARNRVVRVARTGEVRPLIEKIRDYGEPRLSPDGTRLALTLSEADKDLWVYDLRRGAFTRITFERAAHSHRSGRRTARA